MRNLTPIVRNILILNLIVFFGSRLLGFDAVDKLGLRYIYSEQFKAYQFLSHLFVHGSFHHLFSNMFSLVTFGPILEYRLSSKNFLILYLVAGIGAALLYMGVFYLEIGKLQNLCNTYMKNPDPVNFSLIIHKFPAMYNAFYNFIQDFFTYGEDLAYIAKSKSVIEQLIRLKIDVPIVGASGAIFGILTAFVMLFPHARLSLLILPIPIKAKYFLILYGLYELYAGIQANPADNVAHFAHIGGILFAYIFIKLYNRKIYS